VPKEADAEDEVVVVAVELLKYTLLRPKHLATESEC